MIRPLGFFDSPSASDDSLDPKSPDNIANDLLERMAAQLDKWLDILDPVEKDLVDMHQKATVIEQDQKQLKDELDQDQAHQKMHVSFLNLRLSNLFNFALKLGRDQKRVESQLMISASMQQIIRQQALLIQHNTLLIQADLQEADMAKEDIEDQALLVQSALEDIELSIDEMEEIRDAIKDNTYLNEVEKKTEIIEDEKEETKEISDSLLSRMQEACLGSFANICWGISQLNQLLIKWAASSDLCLTQPRLVPAISWIALGALASTGMQDITFSLENMTLKSSFREFVWIKDFADSYQSKAGG